MDFWFRDYSFYIEPKNPEIPKTEWILELFWGDTPLAYCLSPPFREIPNPAVQRSRLQRSDASWPMGIPNCFVQRR